ncbi:LGFP repeat-containing protein [Microbacterium caowuchunii]|uniref:LGFP repeat-containing protein n=1 Tax=Microbacterium caowuchunii TaxID=2614638 RepID=A0A5N0T5P4_9MICO|nr:hypothetical protein [Microbacterium caowuchunii]KAA9130141.1 hypothetical protein F6B40_15810 [Microbacterium caowuchunii]
MTRHIRSVRLGLFALLAVVAMALAPSVAHARDAGGASQTGVRPAADLSQFNPGNIISDEVFFNRQAMSEDQIAAFLRSKVSNCQSGYTCLKDFRQTTTSRAADSYCSGYAGATNEPAARIIYKVAQACGINPQALLVTLQKEQGLVTHTNPSTSRYTIAMGQGCPDTAACDTRYYGFQNQVYGAARQFQIYAEGRYFTYYAPGRTWNILYNPNRDCGSAPVYVANKATAGLYYYTPYQPNAAALRAGYGEGDGCSSYGNRNFYQYFTDWFGQTVYRVDGALNDYWQSQGAAGGWIGQPTAAMRNWSGAGWSQRFSGADLYLQASGSGVYPTIGGTRDEYRLVGEVSSGLGWPTGAVYGAAGGWYQDFRGGRIYVRPSDGAGFAVATPINEVYEAAGNIGGELGWPSNRAYRFFDGSRQDFAGGSIFQGPTATVALNGALTSAYIGSGGPSSLGWPVSTGSVPAGAYATLSKGFVLRTTSGTVIPVTGATFVTYASLGGISGSLGAPTAAERAEGSGRAQSFERGTIYTSSAGTYAVTGLASALQKNGGTAALGYPTAAQVGTAPSLSQNFGTVTLTAGTSGEYVVRGAIGGAYRSMGGAASYLGAAIGLERAVADGFVQDFEGGRIICSPRATVAVPSAVAGVYDAAGASAGRLGWPTGSAVSEAGGWRQAFAGGSVYVTADGKTGAPVVGTTLRTFLNAGGVSALGFPTAAEVESAVGWSQSFQKGIVFVPRSAAASAVVGDIFQGFTSGGGVDVFGFAVGPAAVSSGVKQQPFAQATAYSTPTGAYFVRGYIRTFYNGWGGASGLLGVPRGNEYAPAGGHRQDFAGGSVFVSSTGAFVARGALGAEYLRRGGESGALGWPLGNETSGDGMWQQRFQNGTLVLYANGTYTVR